MGVELSPGLIVRINREPLPQPSLERGKLLLVPWYLQEMTELEGKT